MGDSDHTKRLREWIAKIGPSKSSVLITGPTGTGKELVARALHNASPVCGHPFVALNCAALAPGVLESELFGHEKGAFTGADNLRIGRFEQAHTGTPFLDEVGDIDPATCGSWRMSWNTPPCCARASRSARISCHPTSSMPNH